MPNKEFEDAVKKVEQKIVRALHERWRINVNKESGVAHFPAHTDHVHPCVTVTRDEIRQLAARDELRGVFVETLQEALATRSGLVVEKAGSGGLKVSVTPDRAKENQFPSFTSLTRQNERELAEDPELADDPY
jgi:hypothetical protein